MSDSLTNALMAVEYEDIDAENGPCFLCGEPTRLPAVWIPSDEVAAFLGGAPGMLNVMVWPCCRECYALPDRDALIEACQIEAKRDELAAEDRRRLASSCTFPRH